MKRIALVPTQLRAPPCRTSAVPFLCLSSRQAEQQALCRTVAQLLASSTAVLRGGAEP